MALAHNEIQVTWSSSNSVSISGGGSNNSDSATLSANAIQSQIEVKADHSGTPSAGDTVDFYVLESLGDPDGSSSVEFATNNHGTFVATLDLVDDDPALRVTELPLPSAHVLVRAVNNSSESVTVSATILEQTA